jgi:hypothetical protein
MGEVPSDIGELKMQTVQNRPTGGIRNQSVGKRLSFTKA